MTPPPFTHPVFEQLYQRDYFIDDAVLREILALGPEVAVPELLKITDQALDHSQTGQLPSGSWLANYHFLHALYLLHELRAPAALDVYRRLLRLGPEVADYWFSDYLYEEVPPLLAHAARTRLSELLAMLDDPAMQLQHRLVAAAAIGWLAREQPALRPEISAFLRQHLRHLVTHADQLAKLLPDDPDAIGYEADAYLGMLLLDVQEAGLRELEPELRELYRLGVADESIGGGEADINFDDHRPLLPVPDIFTRYQELRADPDNYSPFHPDAAAIARRRAEEEARYARLRQRHLAQQAPPALSKIGRNDPCFCGSGKKYKKCHGA